MTLATDMRSRRATLSWRSLPSSGLSLSFGSLAGAALVPGPPVRAHVLRSCAGAILVGRDAGSVGRDSMESRAGSVLFEFLMGSCDNRGCCKGGMRDPAASDVLLRGEISPLFWRRVYGGAWLTEGCAGPG